MRKCVITKEQLEDLFVNQKMTNKQAAIELGITPRMVKRYKSKYKLGRNSQENIIKEQKEIETGFRICKQCHNEKPLSEFPKSKLSKHGIGLFCKSCVVIKQYISIHGMTFEERVDELKKLKILKEKEKNSGLRVCKSCKTEKAISEFSLYTNRKNELVPTYYCIICHKEKINQKNKEKYLENPEKYKIRTKNYYNKNTDVIVEKNKIYYNENKDKILPKVREYRNINREEINKKSKEKRRNNPEIYKDRDKKSKKKNRKKINQYRREQFKTNISFRLSLTLRNRMNKILRYTNGRINKSNSTMNLIGCDIDFLKEYLQETAINNGYLDFDINNYDSKQYHVDHIIPCAAFNLKCSYHQKLCFNWKNLQILKAFDNISKNDKVDFSLLEKFNNKG